MAKDKFIIGSRGSQLALWQTNHVKSLIEVATGLPVEIQIIKTTGDKILDVSLAKIGTKGLFVKEIETALLENEVDLAVHSMKDVPTELPEGLGITAVLEREDPRDALLTRNGGGFADIPSGGVVATSSLRRQAQLKHARTDLTFIDLRGNLDTRMKKMDGGEYDAMVLAAAGLKRLGWAGSINEILSFDLILPAVAQGAIGIETRLDDTETNAVISKFCHLPTYYAVMAERKFLSELEGGCQIPIGARAVIEGTKVTLEGVVADLTGDRLYRDSVSGSFTEGDISTLEPYGSELAKKLVAAGADEILEEIRRENPLH